MNKEAPFGRHKGCGGIIVIEPQNDEWGKWDMPVCARRLRGPIVERDLELLDGE